MEKGYWAENRCQCNRTTLSLVPATQLGSDQPGSHRESLPGRVLCLSPLLYVPSAPGASGGLQCRPLILDPRDEAPLSLPFGLNSSREVCRFESSFQNIQSLLASLFSTFKAPHGPVGPAGRGWHLEMQQSDFLTIE